MHYRSCLYECRLMHWRCKDYGQRQGRFRYFRYRIFMFYLDLDELPDLAANLRFIAINRPGLFSFYDNDHFVFENSKKDPPDTLPEHGTAQRTRQRLEKTLREHGFDFDLHRVMLLTHLRILGYIFNPVSFYYCYDRAGKLRTVVAEVNNTFREQKAYVVPFSKKHTRVKQNKLFYVSPFIKYDTDFHFYFEEPGKDLKVRIDSRRGEHTILKAVLQGMRQPIGNAKLAWFFLCYPLLTLRIIFLIHLQALRLYLRKLPYYSKSKTDEEIRQRSVSN